MIFKFLGFILLFVLLLLGLLGFSVVRSVKEAFFGRNKKRTARRSSGQPHNRQSASEKYTRPTTRKKIFAKEEGEYVDYEEVK